MATSSLRFACGSRCLPQSWFSREERTRALDGWVFGARTKAADRQPLPSRVAHLFRRQRTIYEGDMRESGSRGGDCIVRFCPRMLFPIYKGEFVALMAGVRRRKRSATKDDRIDRMELRHTAACMESDSRMPVHPTCLGNSGPPISRLAPFSAHPHPHRRQRHRRQRFIRLLSFP